MSVQGTGDNSALPDMSIQVLGPLVFDEPFDDVVNEHEGNCLGLLTAMHFC